MDLTLAVPVIIGLVEVCKRAGMDTRFASGLAVLLGVFFMGLWGEGVLSEQLFEGVIAGLTASGLYSGAKAVTK